MPYSKKTWVTEELITSNGLNQMSDNIEYMLRMGNNKYVVARGIKAVTFGGVSNTALATINFASDADDGDPGFAAADYHVFAQLYVNSTLTTLPWSGSNIVELEVLHNPPSVSQFGITLRCNNTPSAGHGKYIQWMAIGRIS